MVYDTNTLKILHKLTLVGEQHYHEMLEEEATKILNKNKFKLFIKNILNKIKCR